MVGPAPAPPSDADLLHQAEAAFHEGVSLRDTPGKARPLFRTAATCYESLRQRGAHNADLYRNQGSAFLLAGDLPRAILAYRRGLRLAPADAGIQAGLAYARAQVAYPSQDGFGRPATEHRPPWLPRLWPLPCLVGAVLLYSVAWVAITRWRMTRRGWLLSAAGVAFGAAALLTASLALDSWQHGQESRHPLVVIAEDGVLVRTGNGLAYPPRYETPLNRGVEARLFFARGNWLQIELAGGEVGWVPSGYALRDSP
jgi:hypothetical protein